MKSQRHQLWLKIGSIDIIDNLCYFPALVPSPSRAVRSISKPQGNFWSSCTLHSSPPDQRHMHFHRHPLFCSSPSAKLLNNFTLLNQQSEATLSATRVGSFLLPSPTFPCSHLRKKLNPLQQRAWEVSAPSWSLLSSPSVSPTEIFTGATAPSPTAQPQAARMCCLLGGDWEAETGGSEFLKWASLPKTTWCETVG